MVQAIWMERSLPGCKLVLGEAGAALLEDEGADTPPVAVVSMQLASAAGSKRWVQAIICLHCLVCHALLPYTTQAAVLLAAWL